MILTGDCLEVMPTLEAESVDAVVTDPPYDLGEPRSGGNGSGVMFAARSNDAKARRRGGFMGKAWDGTGIAFRPETWAAAYRLAKPSAYLLAFGGTRTVHRMTCAIEDAGWIVRDMLVWAYASGFPKSKASLKPAWEPIVMARKPGPLHELAIDSCRIGTDERVNGAGSLGANGIYGAMERNDSQTVALGRWPANVILTDPIFDGGWDGVVGGGRDMSGGVSTYRNETGKGGYHGTPARPAGLTIGYPDDGGTYSRFFLIPKADRAEREPIWEAGLGIELGELRTMGDGAGEWTKHGPGAIQRRNVHPTVKPLELMRHLVRLVTPTDGLVLDPFLGSGTTAIAAEMEGFRWTGIEREAEYVAIAEARLNGTQRGLGLPA